MIEEKQIHLYGIDYDSLTKMLYRQGYVDVDRYNSLNGKWITHPDFDVRHVNVTHNELILIVYNPDILTNKRIKELLFEYLI